MKNRIQQGSSVLYGVTNEILVSYIKTTCQRKYGGIVVNHNVVDAIFNDNLECCDLRCVSCTNLKMELFKVTTELKLMTEIVRILKEEMEIMHRTNPVDSKDITSHVNIQDSSKFNNWSHVPKHQLVKDKPVVKSLLKNQQYLSTIVFKHYITYKDQRIIHHKRGEKNKKTHHTPKASLQDYMEHGVASLRNKKLKGKASNKEIFFQNDNEQLQKIPVIAKH
jgi:hypothetical protein